MQPYSKAILNRTSDDTMSTGAFFACAILTASSHGGELAIADRCAGEGGLQ